MEYRLIWPDDFDDYACEVESKGWFSGLLLEVLGRIVRPTFYELERLRQDVSEELGSTGHFVESCVIVLPRVRRDLIEATIKDLARTGELAKLCDCAAGFSAGEEP